VPISFNPATAHKIKPRSGCIKGGTVVVCWRFQQCWDYPTTLAVRITTATHARAAQMNCTLYHLTNANRAEAILREGFKNQPGNHGTDDELPGVWLSDRPLDSNEFGGPDEDLIILSVTFSVPLSELADYE
jgi:hypothetical protein